MESTRSTAGRRPSAGRSRHARPALYWRHA
jgi:hypothetical protein